MKCACVWVNAYVWTESVPGPSLPSCMIEDSHTKDVVTRKVQLQAWLT